RLIGIEPTLRKAAFKLRIGVEGVLARPQTKRFSFKALQKFTQLLLTWTRNNDAASSRFAELDFVLRTKITNAIQVAEKIEDERLGRNKRREHSGPDGSSILAAHWLAVFRFDQLHADSLDPRPEVKSFHIQGKRRKIQLAHSSSSACGNFVRNSGDCLRTSSQ